MCDQLRWRTTRHTFLPQGKKVFELYIHYQYLLESTGFKLINILATHLLLLLSSKTTLFLSLNLLLRFWRCTESSFVGVNHCSNPGIDHCGCLSLQETNYKEEVTLSLSPHATIQYTCLHLFRVMHRMNLMSLPFSNRCT